MLVKLLGILDVLVGLLFWVFGLFGFIPEGLILILGLFLLAKGVAFNVAGLNFISILDIIASGIIVVSVLVGGMSEIVVVLVSLYLIQKGVFSLLG